jgi:hypothetical protein
MYFAKIMIVFGLSIIKLELVFNKLRRQNSLLCPFFDFPKKRHDLDTYVSKIEKKIHSKNKWGGLFKLLIDSNI